MQYLCDLLQLYAFFFVLLSVRRKKGAEKLQLLEKK